MQYEDFLAAENERNEKNAIAHREHLKKQEELMERQVIAQEGLVKHLGEVVKKASEEKK